MRNQQRRTETVENTQREVQAKASVNTMANKIAEGKAPTLGNTLGHVEV